MNSKNCRPKARTRNLYSRKVANETIVYDRETHEASCLDELTTIVWEACDGKTDVMSLLTRVEESGHPASDISLIWTALHNLEKAGLFTDFTTTDCEKGFHDRRKVLRTIGAGAISAVPTITTVSVQPAIAQVSGPCLPYNAYCSYNAQCCSGYCQTHGSGKCK